MGEINVYYTGSRKMSTDSYNCYVRQVPFSRYERKIPCGNK